MKGISHFVSGVAAASFFPWSVEAAYDGNPMYFIIGGAFGVLPDTLDFKFYRFFYHHDVYIEPDSVNPDPQDIADKLAAAIGEAAQRDKLYRVKLSTIRVGADYWQQYVVRFDPENEEVAVKFGPVVNTGQVPVPGTNPENAPIGKAKLPCKFIQNYDATTRVDIFDGPTFGFEADGKGGVELHFLPWHREWTHSLVMAGFMAILGSLIWSWRVAPVVMLGAAAHILEDQLGHMGSNLFFPFTKKRTSGLHLMRSGDAFPNFATVWICCLLVFWNFYRFSPPSVYSVGFFQIALFGGVIPMVIFWVLMRLFGRGGDKEEPIDMADEWGDSKMS